MAERIWAGTGILLGIDAGAKPNGAMAHRLKMMRYAGEVEIVSARRLTPEA
jgi:hypothetical protein